MKIDRFGVYNPMLELEDGQTAEEIRHLIEDNNLNGLSIISNRITPLSIKTLDVLYETTFLKNMSWWVFDNIKHYDFDFLYNYTQLERLHIQNAPLGKIDLGLLPKTLIELRTHWNDNIKFSRDNISIESADISSFKENDCSILKKFKVLDDLSLDCDKKCKSLKGLEAIESLKRLGIGAPLKSFQTLAELTQLTNLVFTRFRVKSLDELSNLNNLQSLSFSSRTITDITAISELQNLTAVSLIGCWKLEDFSAIGKLKNLRFLEIEDCKRLRSINFVKNLPKLEQLTLYGTTVVNDFNLKPAENIERVYIQNNLKQYNVDLEYKSIIGKKYSIQHYID